MRHFNLAYLAEVNRVDSRCLRVGRSSLKCCRAVGVTRTQSTASAGRQPRYPPVQRPPSPIQNNSDLNQGPPQVF
jgi:hypothetical protein